MPIEEKKFTVSKEEKSTELKIPSSHAPLMESINDRHASIIENGEDVKTKSSQSTSTLKSFFKSLMGFKPNQVDESNIFLNSYTPNVRSIKHFMFEAVRDSIKHNDLIHTTGVNVDNVLLGGGEFNKEVGKLVAVHLGKMKQGKAHETFKNIMKDLWKKKYIWSEE